MAHGQIEPLLLEAARQSGLEEPFPQNMELGNFSVTYHASGFLRDVKQFVATQSALNAAVLGTLHGHGIEIVSPDFMTQRPLAPEARILPPSAQSGPVGTAGPPEDLIFDKAESAERVEKLQQEREELKEDLAGAEKQAHDAPESFRRALEQKLARKRKRLPVLDQLLNSEPK